MVRDKSGAVEARPEEVSDIVNWTALNKKIRAYDIVYRNER